MRTQKVNVNIIVKRPQQKVGQNLNLKLLQKVLLFREKNCEEKEKEKKSERIHLASGN